jgi:ketosteroid isomerase-like protein
VTSSTSCGHRLWAAGHRVRGSHARTFENQTLAALHGRHAQIDCNRYKVCLQAAQAFGEGWPLAGRHRGHAELAAVLQKASEEVEMTYPEPPEFVAHGDRVLVVGVATGKIKATNKPFKDNWVFDITVRNGKVTKIREYIDTQALARASQMDASGLA